ncbi:hypothetical protein BGX24_005376 [Mortierella sp. AD032]|nr:hypothetical protein BGX24_005376 [Mortierella sp. AD032]
MPLRALTSKSALATTTTSSSSSATTSPSTLTTNAPAILTPVTSGGRKIRITSSCNYTKPTIRLNLRNLDPESVPASTSSPSPLTPSPPPKALSSKVQPTPSPAPALAPFTPQPSVITSSSSSAPTTTPISSQPTQKTTPSPKPAITTTVATHLTTSTSERTGINYSTNSSSSISLSLGYDWDLSETAMAGNDEEQDPDPDLHHRRQPQRNRLIRSHSSSPLTKYLIHNNNSNDNNGDDNCKEMGSDDPFKELGLKPYSPIWLPSRTPSFDRLMRDDGGGGDGDQSYSVSSRHHEPFQDQNHQVDRELLKGFDLHESTNSDGNVDREIISNMHNRKDPMMGSLSSVSKDRLDSVGNEGESVPLEHYHRYERFGSVRKRPHSPLVPDHFDDLEDNEHDAPLHPALPSQGPSSADARTNEMSNKRSKYDAVEPDQNQDQAQGKAAAHLPPQHNSQARTEGAISAAAKAHLTSGLATATTIIIIHSLMVANALPLTPLILKITLSNIISISSSISSSNRKKTISTTVARMATTMAATTILQILRCATPPNTLTNLDPGTHTVTPATTPINNNNNTTIITTTLKVGSKSKTKTLERTPIGSMAVMTEGSIEDEDVVVEEVMIVVVIVVVVEVEVEVEVEDGDKVELASVVDTLSYLTIV